MEHPEPHPQAGQSVLINYTSIDGRPGPQQAVRILDWIERVGRDTAEGDSFIAERHYIHRAELVGLEDDDVVLGVSEMGTPVCFHQSEIHGSLARN